MEIETFVPLQKPKLVILDPPPIIQEVPITKYFSTEKLFDMPPSTPEEEYFDYKAFMQRLIEKIGKVHSPISSLGEHTSELFPTTDAQTNPPNQDEVQSKTTIKSNPMPCM